MSDVGLHSRHAPSPHAPLPHGRGERGLRTISLCAGGGGLDLGIELGAAALLGRACQPVVLVEREAFACAHLVAAMEAGFMAPAAVWSDVATFDGRPWRGLIDGVVGGIPCQPHSVAGKRLGEDDERDLWSDARRIIVQARPWFVLIENVPGMLTPGSSSAKRDSRLQRSGFERVWRDLRRLGYAVEAGLFSAAETGASHERQRLFILAIGGGHGRQPAPPTTRAAGRP
jgi:DNA (cytosine-5)-methyltransferase 1